MRLRTERGLPDRRWLTVPAGRTVLGVIHNITSATRLLDVLAVFEGDPRVRVVFACTGSSELDGGVAEFAAAHGLFLIPWKEALAQKFDLAVSTSRGGDLEEISAPLIGAPHGAGYNKKLSRNPESGIRNPESGTGAGAEAGAGAGAFGLSAEWLLHDGEVVPSAIVLSHEEQHARLLRDCPEAAPYAHIAGDPCADQLDASAPFRTEYRAALGIRPGQKLLLITSTWGPDSVLGATPDAVRRALAELPYDEYRVLAAVHPNAWYGHGGWQIRNWLKPCLRAGLILPPPAGETWKAAICAADAFLGDHGSLSLYAAARGLPGLLASFGADTVAPGSPMAWLGERLPRLDPVRPLAAQLAAAVALPSAAARITSRPGRSLALLRTLCYRHLALPEPQFPCVPRPVAVPEPAPPGTPVGPALYVDTRVTGREVAVRRYPAEAQRGVAAHLGADVHVVADAAEPDPRLRALADVLVARPGADPAAVLARNPGCALVAGPGPRLVLRDGREFGVPGGVDPATAASALLAVLGEGLDPEGEFALRLGGAVSALRLLRAPAGEADPGFLGPDAAQ
ncbi:hypothetical protein [Streptomyces sp. NBC_01443]|uniref:hypothetical protein n=1 Tax=Streptomyces sp. NBC_01443 TaxID=2903868 RepID=UPI0022517C22|nr:hypothetical protein [Streptomyces sp. NBC_01443]MCX4629367.1 hypothetical protein [Streptomyces sp. NBC_01443]